MIHQALRQSPMRRIEARGVTMISQVAKKKSNEALGSGEETSPERLLSYQHLAEVGILFSRVHLRRMVKKGLFPAPVRISPNRISWRINDIKSWVRTRPIAG